MRIVRASIKWEFHLKIPNSTFKMWFHVDTTTLCIVPWVCVCSSGMRLLLVSWWAYIWTVTWVASRKVGLPTLICGFSDKNVTTAPATTNPNTKWSQNCVEYKQSKPYHRHSTVARTSTIMQTITHFIICRMVHSSCHAIFFVRFVQKKIKRRRYSLPRNGRLCACACVRSAIMFGFIGIL